MKGAIQQWTVGQFCVFSFGAVVVGWFGQYLLTESSLTFWQVVGLLAILASLTWFRIAWIWFGRRD
jgi:hypothetical protein